MYIFFFFQTHRNVSSPQRCCSGRSAARPGALGGEADAAALPGASGGPGGAGAPRNEPGVRVMRPGLHGASAGLRSRGEDAAAAGDAQGGLAEGP